VKIKALPALLTRTFVTHYNSRLRRKYGSFLMVRLIDEAKRIIRSKTKDEWQGWFGAQLAAARTYIQDNGEKAALAGFLVGIFIILFYIISIK
jgi:hypothetical protein